MEHAHDASKAAEKSEGPSIRRNATPPVSSGASAVLALQRAAGNRAVTRMLAAAEGGMEVQPAEPDAPAAELVSAISVQRQMLDKALQSNVTQKTDELWFTDFAKKLIAKVDEPASGKGTESVREEATAAKTKSAAAALASMKLPTNEELDTRKKQLEAQKATMMREARITKGLLTPDERERRAESWKLDRLEQQQKLKQELRIKQQVLKDGQKEYEERLTKLQQGLTPEETELRNKNEELDILEKQQKVAENVKKDARQRKIQARMLNPGKKKIWQIPGIGRF